MTYPTLDALDSAINDAFIEAYGEIWDEAAETEQEQALWDESREGFCDHIHYTKCDYLRMCVERAHQSEIWSYLYDSARSAIDARLEELGLEETEGEG